jgi:hypothetical protein
MQLIKLGDELYDLKDIKRISKKNYWDGPHIVVLLNNGRYIHYKESDVRISGDKDLIISV